MLTGGWQTSKETAYVEATRARHGTDWFIARDQLGEEGQDPDRITRLARRMGGSQLRTPSIAYDEVRDAAWHPGRDPLRLNRLLPRPDWMERRADRDRPERGTAIER